MVLQHQKTYKQRKMKIQLKSKQVQYKLKKFFYFKITLKIITVFRK